MFAVIEPGEIDLVSDDEFDRIVESYSGMIWRICSAYEADPELRSDLHQETLIAVWRALSRFRGEANVRTYIARIAHNRAISYVAKEVRRPKLAELHDDIETTDPSPEDYTATSIRNGKLQAAIRRLPLDQRQPVTLTLEGFTPKEIAEVLGVTANAVSIRMTRAKATLKEQFKDED